MAELETHGTSHDAYRENTSVSRVSQPNNAVLSTVYDSTRRGACEPRIVVGVRGWVKNPFDVPAISGTVESVALDAVGTAIVLLDGGLNTRRYDRRARALVVELPAELIALLSRGGVR